MLREDLEKHPVESLAVVLVAAQVLVGGALGSRLGVHCIHTKELSFLSLFDLRLVCYSTNMTIVQQLSRDRQVCNDW